LLLHHARGAMMPNQHQPAPVRRGQVGAASAWVGMVL
jgi:hypothetical protein